MKTYTNSFVRFRPKNILRWQSYLGQDWAKSNVWRRTGFWLCLPLLPSSRLCPREGAGIQCARHLSCHAARCPARWMACRLIVRQHCSAPGGDTQNYYWLATTSGQFWTIVESMHSIVINLQRVILGRVILGRVIHPSWDRRWTLESLAPEMQSI